MFFPNFPIVFVFPFRLHFELKYIFGCFICKKQIARFRGQSIFPAYCSSLPYTSIPFSGQGQGPAFFFGTMSFYVSFAAPHFHFREKRLALPHSSFILLF